MIFKISVYFNIRCKKNRFLRILLTQPIDYCVKASKQHLVSLDFPLPIKKQLELVGKFSGFMRPIDPKHSFIFSSSHVLTIQTTTTTREQKGNFSMIVVVQNANNSCQKNSSKKTAAAAIALLLLFLHNVAKFIALSVIISGNK